jgi:hypothetical protein
VSVPFVALHMTKAGGCSGFEAWAFNAVFNVALLALFANFKAKTYAKKPSAAKKRA